MKKRCIAFPLRSAILLALCVLLALPLSAFAEEETKTVRVGWFESTFCYRDQFGRRCGIDYEYQHKISAYTGWTYEYVEDSWSNLLQMLMAGEIDLLSDVSYTEERTAYMLFPDLPMGTEKYYIYIDGNNREITAKDPSSFNGKRIGVNKGSVQEGFLRDWVEKNKLEVEIVPLTAEEAESMTMLSRGEIDGYTSLNTFGSQEKIVPVYMVGSSDYYYAVNKNRPDLLAELNMALTGILDEDPYYNQRVSDEQLHITKSNAFLTPSQEEWLDAHGKIRVAYLDSTMPFCQADKDTGELTGALSDFLAHAVNSVKDADIQFEAVPYASIGAALAAIKGGQADCMFPVNLSTYDASEMGIRLTNPAMKSEMNVLMRASDSQSFSRNSSLVFAVPTGNVNVETFIKEHFPSYGLIFCADAKACYEAVAAKRADCVLVSNYRIPDAENILRKYNLYNVPTGEAVELSFAVNQADRELYFILNKIIGMTNSEEMDSALASYMRADQKVTFTQFLRDNWWGVAAFLTALFGVIVFLLLQKMKAERKAGEQQHLLEEAAEIAELKQTITSLLDNMPGMNFTKDAKTGEYLACSQSYAEFAHKASPQEVVGLTDAQIFDAPTAAHFAEDDKMALSMDAPYIFYEDMPDEEGNMRQLQTTRMKYVDAAGRQCLLGMCQDVTDNVRVRRENATSKEAYEKARSTGIIYTHLAQALARGYTDLYYINLNTEQYIEYRSDDESGTLTEARRGWHYFEECKNDVAQSVYPEDQEAVLKALNRKNLVSALERNRTFVMTYRRNSENGPVHVMTRVSRMEDDDRYIVLGVTDVDEQMKQRSAAERAVEEQIAYARLRALAGDYLSIFVVDPESGRYREFSATADFDTFAHSREGADFFTDTVRQGRDVVYPDDLNRFLSAFTKENVLSEVERNGIFTLSYRLMIDGRPRYVQLKASMVEEKEGKHLIVGINDIDAQVRQEEKYVQHLAEARIEAKIDALTGIKNRHSYLDAEERLNVQIAEGRAPEFAVSILDINDLKTVNDTEGHAAGDQLIKNACRIVCTIFKHSPVFRIGGDEFAVISQGSDYAQIDELVKRVAEQNEEARNNGGVIIACGMSKYDNDGAVAPVFERADENMYENKSTLKAAKE